MLNGANGRIANGHPNVLRPEAASSGLDDRLPPQNLVAERGVLGSILLDNAVLHDVAPILEADDFYRDSHATIYRAIRRLYDESRPIDAITLSELLTRLGEYAAVGGDDALAEVLGSVPHAASGLYYAQIVVQKSIGRRIIEACNESLAEAYRCDSSADELVARYEARAFAVGHRATLSEPIAMAAAVAAALDRIDGRRDGNLPGVPTGLADLDALLGGCLVPGELVIVAGRPGMGKSALASGIALDAAKRGVGSLLVSLEMGSGELVDRLIAGEARVPGRLLKEPWLLDDRQRARLHAAANTVSGLPVRIDDAPTRTMAQVASLGRRARARDGIGLLVVDYIQLVEPDESRGVPRHEQVAKISRRLKTLAKELGIPVLALSQLNRLAEAREDNRPRLSDLRESGAIEQDADIVVLVHRPDYYKPDDKPGLAEAIVAKNRNGRTGTVDLMFMREYTRFENLGRMDAADFE